MTKPLCIVIGVGPGNGASFARRFSSDAHHVAILARNANYLRLHPGYCTQATAVGIRCDEWREGSMVARRGWIPAFCITAREWRNWKG